MSKKNLNYELKLAKNHCRAAEVIQVKVKMLFRISLVSKLTTSIQKVSTSV